MTEAHERLLSIVVPVYNEAESLPILCDEIAVAMAGRRYEIIFVDDGSTDASFSVCCERYEADPEHMRVVRLRRNFGQTAALAAGFDAAHGDVIITMDADLQNDPSDLPRLLERLDAGADLVSGWRANRRDAFFSRRLPSLAANALISWITGVPLHDYGCTLKAYRRAIVSQMNLYGELHRFLPALATWAGADVAELEVNHRRRRYGTSKYGLGRILRVLLDLITVKFLLSYSTKPMQVFGAWGFVSILLGFAAGVLTALLKIFADRDVTGNPWMYFCIFFTLGGLQLVGLGLLGEINVRTYYETQHKPIYTVRDRLGLE
ncbi:MAG TPA: glycosyltransferase [Candidatus Hydrogenedentes bacterium]|nr:glycosyltransferase [Candidatus Hydrogenedentota bacterium]